MNSNISGVCHAKRVGKNVEQGQLEYDMMTIRAVDGPCKPRRTEYAATVYHHIFLNERDWFK